MPKKRHLGKKERRSSQLLLSIILDAFHLKGKYMIILDSKKINSEIEKSGKNFMETLNIYENTSNFGYNVCPNCKSSKLIRWGKYERNVIGYGKNNELQSEVITIQRVKCKSCGKTHALLPLGIIPYKQFADEVVSDVLLDLTIETIEKVADKYSISEDIIKKWKTQFKEYHKSRTSTLMAKQGVEMLRDFLREKSKKIEYIIKNNRCFMQIKLGCLGLGPS